MKTKYFLKNIIWIFFFILVLANISIFVSGIKLGNEINYFEKEIKNYHQINIELEKEKSTLSSLQYVASLAASLDFTKKTQPIYLENLQYAMNK